jgi:hypothetical protein
MATTVFEPEKAQFSDRAHAAAQRLIYPQALGVEWHQLQFETARFGTSERNSILDGELAVDRIVTVTVEDLQAPLKQVVQERFREPEYARWKDLTITEWNWASGEPGELHKMAAGLFLYGYFDECNGTFLDAIMINVPALLLAIGQGNVKYERWKNPKQQSFLAFRFDALHEAGLVCYRLPCVT